MDYPRIIVASQIVHTNRRSYSVFDLRLEPAPSQERINTIIYYSWIR